MFDSNRLSIKLVTLTAALLAGGVAFFMFFGMNGQRTLGAEDRKNQKESVQQGKSYYAKRFDVDLQVEMGGTLLVTEMVEFQFVGGPFTYVYRELALTETDGIELISAAVDGAVIPWAGAGSSEVNVSGSDPLRVRWNLPQIFDSTHTYTLVYRVKGVVRLSSEADQIIWRAIPQDHEYVIACSQICWRYPTGITPLGTINLEGAASQVQQLPGEVLFAVGELEPNKDLIVSGQFPPGALGAAEPQWMLSQQQRQAVTQSALRGGIVGGLVGILSALAAGLKYLGRYRREMMPVDKTRRPSSPPGDLLPALAARLCGGNPALGVLFDLASRGVVSIEEGPRSWGTRQFVLLRKTGGLALNPFEQALLTAVFSTRSGLADSLPLGQVGQKLAGGSKVFEGALDEALTGRELLDPERKSASRLVIFASVVALITGGAIFVIGAILLSGRFGSHPQMAATLLGAIGGAGVGLALGGLLNIISAGIFSPLTQAGLEQAALWKGFRRYLSDVASGTEPAQRPDLFEAYLPYAAAFNLGEKWVRYFRKRGDTTLPEWFHSLKAADFDGFVAAMGASSASTSSDGGASAGGGGASGGGGSGAG